MSGTLRGLKRFVLRALGTPKTLERLHRLMARREIARLKSGPRYQNPKSLIPHGRQVYSQHEEDGMIAEVFERVGATNRVFVEIGVGTGLENNTLALLIEGWQGLWVEASGRNAGRIRKGLANVIRSGRLKMTRAFATKENINDLISSATGDGEIDLLSVDIDGNDVHVFNAITCVRPRVVVIEYNAKFPPPTELCVEYDASRGWAGDDCFGASLKFLEAAFAEKGYRLVGCDLTGSNAFFVRDDLVGDRFLAPYTAENHYEPARYYLTTAACSGHPPSYATVEQLLATRGA